MSDRVMESNARSARRVQVSRTLRKKDMRPPLPGGIDRLGPTGVLCAWSPWVRILVGQNRFRRRAVNCNAGLHVRDIPLLNGGQVCGQLGHGLTMRSWSGRLRRWYSESHDVNSEAGNGRLQW